MAITVNGAVIDDARIAREAANHAGTGAPKEAAACALAIRELLLQRARAAGVLTAAQSDDDAVECAIEQLLAREAPVPEPDEDECRRFYARHVERYSSGALVEAAHILFAVTPNALVDAIRRQAEATLREARAHPERFAELAASLSNCPSGRVGGSLGQVRRGELVPEVESALFGAEPGVLERLVNSRYGFHVLKVEHAIAGKALPFEAVRGAIAATLRERVRMVAARQYVRILAAQASIEGLALDAAAGPLMQ